jgi:hypothetical protein
MKLANTWNFNARYGWKVTSNYDNSTAHFNKRPEASKHPNTFFNGSLVSTQIEFVWKYGRSFWEVIINVTTNFSMGVAGFRISENEGRIINQSLDPIFFPN